MTEVNLSLIIEPGHPAYEWAKKQSDSVNAFGHIGTHIDCYDSVPEHDSYDVDVIMLDCTHKMPTNDDISSLNDSFSGKALVLFTGNIEKNNYGTKEYGSTATCLTHETLNAILSKSPAFIVIDSYGIGTHGDEHIAYDKKCEAHNCYVIENVILSSNTVKSLQSIKLDFDKTTASTGKRCNVIGVFK